MSGQQDLPCEVPHDVIVIVIVGETASFNDTSQDHRYLSHEVDVWDLGSLNRL